MRIAMVWLSAILLCSSCSNTSRDDLSSNKTSTEQEKATKVSTKIQSNKLESPIRDPLQKERFNQFIQNSHTGTTDTIQITDYTIEGDPIVKELHFNGQNFEITIDTTKDEYGQKDINKYMCSKIEGKDLKEIGGAGVNYELEDCSISNNLAVAIVE